MCRPLSRSTFTTRSRTGPPRRPANRVPFRVNDLRGLDKFLRGELRFQLLHYKRDRRRAVPDPEDTLAAATGPSDPAREAEQREALRDIAQIVNDELSNADLTPAARAYFVADRIEGPQARRDPASPRLERASDQAITQRAARARRRVAMASDGRAHPRRAHQRAACARAARARAWPGRAVRGRGRRRRSRRHAARRRGHEDRRRVPGVSGLWRRALRRARPPPHSANQDDNPGDAHATGAPSGPRSPDTGHDLDPHPIRDPTPTSSRAGSRRSHTSGTSSNVQDAPRQAPEFSFESAASGSSSTATSPSAETQSAPSTASPRAPSTSNHEFGFER